MRYLKILLPAAACLALAAVAQADYASAQKAYDEGD